MDSFWVGVAVTVVGGIVLLALQRMGLPYIAYLGLKVEKPVIENPYPKDKVRRFPVAVRFFRSTVRAKMARLSSLYGTISIRRADGEPFDAPGALHWQRQPREGVAHPIGLHDVLHGPDDARNHLFEFHLSQNKPIDIRRGESDKLDLLLRLDGLEYAMPTVSRENRLTPGEYDLELRLHADNIWRSKRYSWRVAIGPELEDIQVIDNLEGAAA